MKKFIKCLLNIKNNTIITNIITKTCFKHNL